MDTFDFGGRIYYHVDNIIEKYRIFNKGCGYNSLIIKKYKLVCDDDYLYARLNKNGDLWEPSNGKGKKVDELFIRKIWFRARFPTEEDLEAITDYTEQAPPIIELKDNKKFYDDEGNFAEIEEAKEIQMDVTLMYLMR